MNKEYMKKLFLLIHFAIGLKSGAIGQDNDSLRYKYNNQTIYRYGSGFMRGSERLTFQQISKEFSMSDLGLDLYNRSKKYKTISRVLNYAGLTTGAVAIAVMANHGNRNLALGLYGGYFVLFTAGIRYSSLSGNTLNKALWQRNKDVLFPPQQ